MNIDAIIHARWIIPVEPAGTVLEQHALAVNDGRIIDILDSSEADKQYTATSVVHLDGHALLPGLINTHGHASMTLMRGLADDLPMMTWLHEHVWPTEQKWVSADFVYDGSLLACAEMLRGGITCFNDMYFFPEETVRAVEQSGMRASVGLIVVDFPSAWAQDADDYLNKGIELHDQLHNHSLITTTFAPHAPYSVSDAPLQRIAMLAEELDIPIHMHVHETADEVQLAVEKHGKRPLQRLDDLGLLSPRLLAVHMTQLNNDEIKRCAETGVHVVHCPESNLKLASGFCPVHDLNKAGINVALGTDGAASNNDLNMFGEMRTAALLGKGIAADASAVPSEQVLRMATINAARSLGLDEHIGSLQAGKAADFIAVQLDGIETEPVYNPVSQLVYATGRDKVTDVWVAGKHLLKDRILTTLETEEILANTREWRARIARN
ncbi:MAG: TRZ/ATZ family hydrolase [Gammaproteobacteria bacterium]|nr:TRZ/ATZ family hydrolase [Gammaproteobacteria bacterium]